jgi:hypothetical protein
MFPSPTRMFLTKGVGVHRHVTTIGRATAASRRTLWRVASASGWVRDEQVERIPRPGSRRRKRLGGIGEIFTVRAVHRC